MGGRKKVTAGSEPLASTSKVLLSSARPGHQLFLGFTSARCFLFLRKSKRLSLIWAGTQQENLVQHSGARGPHCGSADAPPPTPGTHRGNRGGLGSWAGGDFLPPPIAVTHSHCSGRRPLTTRASGQPAWWRRARLLPRETPDPSPTL